MHISSSLTLSKTSHSSDLQHVGSIDSTRKGRYVRCLAVSNELWFKVVSVPKGTLESLISDLSWPGDSNDTFFERVRELLISTEVLSRRTLEGFWIDRSAWNDQFYRKY